MTRILCPLLVGLVVITSLAITMTRHQSRKLFVELQALEQGQDAMNDEWGRLQLEQATLGTHGRIEERARSALNMTMPSVADVIIVTD
ncbi:MAG: cell division protein FtsL [Gammaproteobacteria bacterium]